jgi:hypothetical protein
MNYVIFFQNYVTHAEFNVFTFKCKISVIAKTII